MRPISYENTDQIVREGDESIDRAPSARLQRIVSRYANARNLPAAIELGATILIVCAGYWFSAAMWQRHWLSGLISASIPAIGLVRLFVIQHDCGHGAFFPSKTQNDRAGLAISLLTLFPYAQWRENHAKHHRGVGNLESRGAGDVTTITRAEYVNRTRIGRLAYRIYRHPLVLVGLGGAFYTLWRNRLPRRVIGTTVIGRYASSQSLNLVILSAGFVCWELGILANVARVAIPAIALGGSLGITFFYAGHQFEHTHWSRPPEWNLRDAALKGSSHLALPEPLAWLTGYIGVHHVHHLNSRVPLYNMRACLRENPALAKHNRISLFDALRSLRLAVWDEEKGVLTKI